jgi:lysozyme family protein
MTADAKKINFDVVIPTILKQEGGFVDDPNDHGGSTNFGLSLRFLKTIYPNADREFVKNLTKEQAINIYREHLWNPMRYNELPNVQFATKVFSMAVNCGYEIAIRCLQRALNCLEIPCEEDGILGSQTLAAANSCTFTGGLFYSYKSEMAGYYRTLATRLGTQYLKGWLDRAYS